MSFRQCIFARYVGAISHAAMGESHIHPQIGATNVPLYRNYMPQTLRLSIFGCF